MNLGIRFMKQGSYFKRCRLLVCQLWQKCAQEVLPVSTMSSRMIMAVFQWLFQPDRGRDLPGTTGTLIRSKLNETDLCFDTHMFKQVGREHEWPLRMAMNKGRFTLVIPGNFRCKPANFDIDLLCSQIRLEFLVVHLYYRHKVSIFWYD